MEATSHEEGKGKSENRGNVMKEARRLGKCLRTAKRVLEEKFERDPAPANKLDGISKKARLFDSDRSKEKSRRAS